MQTALTSFYSISDSGLTPYRAALQMAKSAISGDTSAATNTKYIIVFLSDGLPDPEVSDAILASDIASILALKPNQITFNAIYYGSADAQATARLAAMASTGKGQFLDTNSNSSGSQFVISDVINVAGLNCAK